MLFYKLDVVEGKCFGTVLNHMT